MSGSIEINHLSREFSYLDDTIKRLEAENGRLRDYIKSLGERMEKVSDEQGVCKAVVDRWIVEIREALADGK